MTNQRLWHGINKTASSFGFGCWQIAGVHKVDGKPHGWGIIDESEALDILCYAIENGITFFDTAQGYNYGKSEQLLGKAIKQSDKDVIVCTKIPLSTSEISNGKIGADFVKKIECSLKNLQSSYIDILLIHNPPDNTNWNSFDYELLDKLVHDGIIGTYGVSAKGLKGAKNVVENKVGTTLEWVFNLLERRPINDLFPLIEANNMNFIARSPLSRGILSSKFIEQEPTFNSNDFRVNLPKDWVVWAVNEVRSLEAKGLASNEITNEALNFIRSYNQVNAFIPGIKSMQHLKTYLKVKDSFTENFNQVLLNDTPRFYPKWS